MQHARHERLLAILSAFLLIVGLATASEGFGDGGTFTPSVDDVAAPPTEAPSESASPTTVAPGPTTSPSPAPIGVGTAAPTNAPSQPGGPGQPPAPNPGGQPSAAPTTAPTTSPTTAPTTAPTTNPGPTWPSSGIYSAEEARIGLTDTTMNLCMHAAFLLGPVFDNRPADEDVYWRMINDQGGVHGREVSISFTDDQYTASGAAQAAAECDDREPFLMLGGVGFDQTPTVRNYAEENRIPYFHSVAVQADPAALDHSYTGAPTIETVGRFVAQRTKTAYGNKKIGVIWVNSENWKAGRDSYLDELKRLGIPESQVVFDRAVPNNNEQFTPHIVDMVSAEVEVLYLHMNALAMSRFFKEADQQDFYPVVLGEDGFNLVPETSGEEMRKFPPAEVVWVTPAFNRTDTSSPYYGEMKTMLDAYAKYLPEKNVNDVDWMFWLAFKQLHVMLEDCGANCDRNIFTGMVQSGYRKAVTPMCDVDFSRGGGHFGGYQINLYRAVPSGDTTVWKQTQTCASSL